MKEETNHVYELAKKEEKELEGKIRAELDSLGKPEMRNDVQQYAIDFLLRTTWERLKGL
jgi:hypothetical protein|nr:MAG TPA: hypothetical protein [Caudoviricetes sp.]